MTWLQDSGHTTEMIDYDPGTINTPELQHIYIGTRIREFNIPPGSIVTNFDHYKFLYKVLTPEMINTCTIWDYSQENIDLLKHDYPDAKCCLFEMGYSPILDYHCGYEETDKDIDVLFLGGISDRRRAILDTIRERNCRIITGYTMFGPKRAELLKRAKIVLSIYSHNWRHAISASRLTPSLCCNAFIIAEKCTNEHQENRWAQYVKSVDCDQIADTVVEYLNKPQERKLFADGAYEAFKQTRVRITPDGYDRILVTGGTGMVGKALQAYARENKRYVFVGSKDADLTDLTSTKALFDRVRPDAVIHLASVVGGLFYNIKNNAQMLDLNTRININVARCSVEAGVRKVIMVNSTCAFPAESPVYPLTEQDLHHGPVHASNEGYGASKRIAEIVGRLYSESTPTKFVTVYPCNLYGPGDNFDTQSCHVLSGLLVKAHESMVSNTDMVVWGSGNPLRQFLYVEDLVRLLVMVLEQFNGSSMILCPNKDDEITINNLAIKICSVIGNRQNITNDLTKSDGLFKKTVSNAILSQTFPYFQYTSLDEGIRKIYDWYLANCAKPVPKVAPKVEPAIEVKPEVEPKPITISGNLPGFRGLAGGIGNQLFLVAAVLTTAWDSDANVVFRLDMMHKYRYQNDYRRNLLKQFPFTDDDLHYGIIHQSAFPKDGTGLRFGSNAMLEGYFQSPLYFVKYADRIRRELFIEEPQANQIVQSLRNTYPGKRIVSIQVRRGDYLSLGWTLPTHYYKNAMTMVGDNVVFVVSTDDKQWCNMIFPGVHVLDCPDWIEFLVLCQLDGIIMSNSTFGWWVAFLGNLPSVVAPDPWFKNNEYDTSLYLEGWKRLEW